VIQFKFKLYHFKFKQAFILSLFCFLNLQAQNKDTAFTLIDSNKAIILVGKDSIIKQPLTNPPNYRSPRKAAILSAILPGLGQAYNKSYWKIPIIYVGLGFLGYLTSDNHASYQKYRRELIYRIDNPTLRNDYPNLEERDLITQKEIFRKYRDLSGLGFILTYVANIIEANVDAHLMTYDMSDDLSLKWQPNFYDFKQQQGLVGLTFTLKIKH
jgi:hypothetical protein